MAHNPGGGHKINLLKPVIAEYKDKKNLLIMFTDRLDYFITLCTEYYFFCTQL